MWLNGIFGKKILDTYVYKYANSVMDPGKEPNNIL